jgi:hypothetical protein
VTLAAAKFLVVAAIVKGRVLVVSVVDILSVGNWDVNNLTVGNLDVDILTIGNLDVDILTIGN